MNGLRIAGAAALMAFTAACGNTADGAKKDADSLAANTTEAAAATGTAMAGAMETGQVKTWLTADTRVDASDINVDTNEGTKTVTLKGTVPADSQKTIAEQITKDKAVGYTIVNELTIRPK
ncbi:MAG: BON domain-containing protein [Phycisphaerae bacterium]|nr:BON domain-containing protein [Gemmatimonadaceae bacterium]